MRGAKEIVDDSDDEYYYYKFDDGIIRRGNKKIKYSDENILNAIEVRNNK